MRNGVIYLICGLCFIYIFYDNVVGCFFCFKFVDSNICVSVCVGYLCILYFYGIYIIGILVYVVFVVSNVMIIFSLGDLKIIKCLFIVKIWKYLKYLYGMDFMFVVIDFILKYDFWSFIFKFIKFFLVNEWRK